MPSRNFRAQYLDRVVGIGRSTSEVTQLLDSQILGDSQIDRQKLIDFTLKYNLPADRRVKVWMILLNVTSDISAAVDYVNQQRYECFMLLNRSLATMNKLSIDSLDKSRPLSTVTILRMYWLQNRNLPIGDDTCIVQRAQWKPFCHLSTVMTTVGEENWHVFWLTRNLFDTVTAHFTKDVLAAKAAQILDIIHDRDTALYDRLTDGGHWSLMPLSEWHISVLAAITPHCDALLQLIDKVIAGNYDLITTTITELLIDLSSQILWATDSMPKGQTIKDWRSFVTIDVFEQALHIAANGKPK